MKILQYARVGAVREKIIARKNELLLHDSEVIQKEKLLKPVAPSKTA